MKKLIKIFISVFLFSPIGLNAEPFNDLANDLLNQIKSAQTIRMAVLHFPYIDGFNSSGCKIVQERMITAFSGDKKFSLMERSLLYKVLEEKKLQMSGLFDEETTIKLGKMLGVEAVLTGTLIDVSDLDVEINARIINTITGEIISSGKTTIKKIWKDKINIPKPIFDPTPLPKIEEVNMSESNFNFETKYEDIETLEKYDKIAEFDKSSALPLEKAEKWKTFAGSYPKYRDIALKRAKEWEDYDREFKKAEELKAKKLEALKRDYQTLRRYLALTIISDEQKSEWAEKFMGNYGYDEDNIYANEISKYLRVKAEEEMNWDDAVDYCKEKGMRLPTVAELEESGRGKCFGSRYKYNKNKCNKWYWSSEEYGTEHAMNVSLRFGNVGKVKKTNSNAVYCIQAGP
ncbi:MAG: SUMF1/EgtB/PvdO family nonheme iron enzyme [Elusimicrobia bacterium]|nr:SUMF1/EgtB/PvdO family nonheme iron enzyme [Elusimicrobiota bacterium]